MDLKKAFDTVEHKILLYKLQYYGIRGLALEWFKSYLSNRNQFVMTKDTQSNNIHLCEYGVPQGSVLGTILFPSFINKDLLVFLAPNIIFIGQMEKDIGRGVSRVQYLSTADQ